MKPNFNGGIVESKSGIIVLNKPVGISSNTAVNKVKRMVNAKKAGHLGTLDVLGEGVLLVTLNKATKLFDYFLKKDKTYRAVFVFGFETSTLDCEGEISDINYRLITNTEIENVLEKFRGKISQVPPQFSALKINGRKAYDLARKGETADLKPREVEIFDLKLLSDVSENIKKQLTDRFMKFHDIDLNKNESVRKALENNMFELEITCSSGTYIRSLCRDIAKALTTCGTMLCIVRTRCGNFNLDEAVSIDDIQNGKYTIIDVDTAIDLSSFMIEEEDGKKILNGLKVKKLPIQTASFKLYCGNEFYGIANNRDGGIIQMEVFLKD